MTTEELLHNMARHENASIERAMDHPDYMLIRAEVFAQAEEFDKAMELYQIVLDYQSDCVDAWIGIGTIHLNRHEDDDARDAYHKALMIKPLCIRAMMGLSLVQFDRGNRKAAMELLAEAAHMEQ